MAKGRMFYTPPPKRQVPMTGLALAYAEKNANDAIREKLLTAKISLYMLTEGEPCKDTLGKTEFILKIVLIACAVEDVRPPRYSLLRGAISACNMCMRADYYYATQTAAMATGLDVAIEIVAGLKGISIVTAYKMAPSVLNSATEFA